MSDLPSRSSPSTLGISYILQRKLSLYFALCFLGCVLAFLAEYYLDIVGQNSFQAFPQMERYAMGAVYTFPALAILILLFLFVKDWSLGALVAFDIVFSILFLSTMSFMFSTLFPGQGFLYPYVVMLLLHATLVPNRPWVQGLLGAISLACFGVGKIVSYEFLSESQRIFIAQDAGKGFWKIFTLESMFLFLVAALATEIVRELYVKSSPSPMDARFGNYVIKKFLGTGGMGKVYLATHNSLCRPTALKILQPKAEDFPTSLSRFEREVKLCATLTHPNTVTIFDFGSCNDSTFYYAMEYLEGLDLQKLVDQYGPVPPARLIYIMIQICSALGEAHQKNIVHRDIKPSNIFLACIGGVYDFVKVLDFGLAKEIRKDVARLTDSHIFLGTPTYVAPEMILNRQNVDPRTDIYLCGCVAYWTLTGKTPFEGENDAQILVEHVKTLPKWPSELSGQDIPVELERIIMRCLEKSMDDRFQSTEELIAALESVPVKRAWNQAQAKEWWKHHCPDRFIDSASMLREIPLTKEPQRAAAGAPPPP